MKTLTKEEVTAKVGKGSFWFPKSIIGLNYIAGITGFDELLDPNSMWSKSAPFNIWIHPMGIEVQMMYKLKFYRAAFLNDDVLSITMEDKEQVFEKKDKSMVGRAVVGGLLLGPVGAVVGGMTALKGDVEVKSNMPDLLISLVVNENGKEKAIVISTEYKKQNEVEKAFKDYFPLKFQKAAPITPAATKEVQLQLGSVADELLKLKGLLDADVLTQREFEEQKSKLLNR